MGMRRNTAIVSIALMITGAAATRSAGASEPSIREFLVQPIAAQCDESQSPPPARFTSPTLPSSATGGGYVVRYRTTAYRDAAWRRIGATAFSNLSVPSLTPAIDYPVDDGLGNITYESAPLDCFTEVYVKPYVLVPYCRYWAVADQWNISIADRFAARTCAMWGSRRAFGPAQYFYLPNLLDSGS